ncbi:MAG: aminotransferase class IV [Planctomycetes bacterium]|nr:aminotransferase class IV [Planctomycetota bacterium]MCH9726315.1 aminotransferase class IV [Planctomycetota bacterium]MCH9776407.1 aminotransferase class IV [Planctomycetota bacterium]MCH9789991.1 aminotransferase class IV [Planctomycetota bacterium]
MTEPRAYLNGSMIPFSDAKLAVTDLGIVYGASITEVVRTFAHRLFKLDEHIDRLFSALDYVFIEPALEKAELKEVCESVVEHNSKLLPSEQDLGLTIFITAGHNLPYLGLTELETCQTPTVCVHTFPLAFELWDSKYMTGQHLMRAKGQQLNANIFDPRIKSRSRIHLYRADKQVRMQEPKASALLFDQSGFVSETTIGNFYLVKDDVIQSPRPENILGGISQMMVVHLAKQLGIRYEETDISENDILDANEALTSSTAYCLMPVTRFGDHVISDGLPGPVFQKLISAWSQMVGVDIVQQAQHRGEARRNAPS